MNQPTKERRRNAMLWCLLLLLLAAAAALLEPGGSASATGEDVAPLHADEVLEVLKIGHDAFAAARGHQPFSAEHSRAMAPWLAVMDRLEVTPPTVVKGALPGYRVWLEEQGERLFGDAVAEAWLLE